MTRKLSKTQQWLRDHPHDEPPPKSGGGALAWREKRFGWKVDRAREQYEADRTLYEKALQESRAAKAEDDYPRIN
jgi:hypothetical protein